MRPITRSRCASVGPSPAGASPYRLGMTFSIVARSADGTALGVAVASKFLAAGAAVPAAEADVGAVATQSDANLAYRPQALAPMRTGMSAADAAIAIIAPDRVRAPRPVG